MPTNEIQFPPLPSGFRLAMNFDVTGNNVVAGGFGSNFCDNVESGFEFGSAVAVAGLSLRMEALPWRLRQAFLLKRYPSRVWFLRQAVNPGPGVMRCR
jgi:hypothetical protein